jgi:hypothetical protein
MSQTSESRFLSTDVGRDNTVVVVRKPRDESGSVSTRVYSQRRLHCMIGGREAG